MVLWVPPLTKLIKLEGSFKTSLLHSFVISIFYPFYVQTLHIGIIFGQNLDKSEKSLFWMCSPLSWVCFKTLLEIHTRVKQSVIGQALCETEVVVERVVERLRLPSCRKTNRATAAAARPKQAPGLCTSPSHTGWDTGSSDINRLAIYHYLKEPSLPTNSITHYDTKYAI